MSNRPNCGEIYRHFKGGLYQVITIAQHSETKEELVIYQALYGDFKCYARPLQMFMSEVDHEKYPEVKQEFRFERRTTAKTESNEMKCHAAEDNQIEAITEEASQKTAFMKNNKMEYGTAEEKMMAFFDTDDLEERYQILLSLREDITNTMIDNMAVVMDIVIEDGNLTKRYDDLKYAIQTKQRYEQSTRLH